MYTAGASSGAIRHCNCVYRTPQNEMCSSCGNPRELCAATAYDLVMMIAAWPIVHPTSLHRILYIICGPGQKRVLFACISNLLQANQSPAEVHAMQLQVFVFAMAIWFWWLFAISCPKRFCFDDVMVTLCFAFASFSGILPPGLNDFTTKVKELPNNVMESVSGVTEKCTVM